MTPRLAIRAAALAMVGLGAVAAVPAAADVPGSASSSAGLFPTTLQLPDGFQPEGIATGPGPVAFFGSRADGSIFAVNLITGRGRTISPGPGTPSLGMKTDARGRLFVAGGTGGDGRVVDTRSGRVLASYQFATGTTFVNDVILTPDAAWFTDSRNPVLYEVPLGRHGALPDAGEVRTLPLSGDFVLDPAAFNLNGISRTPDGRGLLVIQSGTGFLFRVDTRTGVTTRVDLGGELLSSGDGLLLVGRTLFAVQNVLNTVAVVRLNRSGTAGQVVDRLTDPRFDIPTTVAAFAGRLYLPNARFSTPPEPTTPYTANAIPSP